MHFSIPLLLTAALPAVLAQTACPPLHFIYARATTEPPTRVDNANAAQFEAAAARVWSKGYGAAGYSIYTNLTSLIPAATGWPVHYPASFSGCTSEDKGVADIINRITTVARACPNTLFALGGHSQGGVVTVRAIPQIPADVLRRVVAVTMVGSPACPAQVRDRCKSYCNQGDAICSGTGSSSITGRCRRSAIPDAWTEADTLSSQMLAERSPQIGGGRAPDCSGPEPPEKGHRVTGRQSAHMAYNEDGFYTRAAACYIQKRYQAAGGA